jgi:hypothetical protein
LIVQGGAYTHGLIVTFMWIFNPAFMLVPRRAKGFIEENAVTVAVGVEEHRHTTLETWNWVGQGLAKILNGPQCGILNR